MTKPKLNSLMDIQKVLPDEKASRDFLISRRWPKGLVCIKCGSMKRLYLINGGDLIKCSDCKKQFSVRVGTIFEDSALPLQKWFFAIYLITAHKKGISSCQLARDIKVTQKTAWFMLHRIRHGLATKSFHKPLDGIVEVDETYVGGKEKNKHRNKRKHVGTGGAGKAAVLGMLDRDDNIVVTSPIRRVNARTLQGMMKSHIHVDSRIMTDEGAGYRQTGQNFKSHETVSHFDGEYVRGDVHTNTLDGFWSLMKRGLIGIYHQVSVEQLHATAMSSRTDTTQKEWMMLKDSTQCSIIAKEG